MWQYEGEEKCIQDFGEDIEGRGHLEDAGVYGRIILKWNKEMFSKSVDRLDLAQDRDTWQAIVSKVINTQVAYDTGNMLRSQRTVGFSGRVVVHRIMLLSIIVTGLERGSPKIGDVQENVCGRNGVRRERMCVEGTV